VSAADVQVMISAGFYGVYSELGPAFERASGHHLITTRGPSMGDSPEAIPTRLARGEVADVVILDGGAADELGRRGSVRADSKVALARSLIGMVVRAGAAKPDIGNVKALRNTLLAAQSIAYSDSGSGTYLSTTLFPKLGIADQIAGKSRKVRGPPSGEPVAAVVARGEAEIGFQQVSELIHVPGITFVGTIPNEVQPPTFFAGALTNTVQHPEAASALIRFLSSPEAAPVIMKAGLTPLSERPQAEDDISGTYKLIVEQRKIVETGETDPEASIKSAADWLRAKNIGALVVTSGDAVLGLISEREIVQAFARYGETIGSMPVKDIMRYGVTTVSADESVNRVMNLMTHHRVRHMLVLRDGRLAGIISIGDVVKHRLEDLELETNVLRDAYNAAR
jgi:molybdate transport system substrate-binding protein